MKPGVVTSEKLRLMKCPVCGSRDKNVDEILNVQNEPVLKILACNQCGHLTMFGIAAAVVQDILTGNVKGVESYDELVRSQHSQNHSN